MATSCWTGCARIAKSLVEHSFSVRTHSLSRFHSAYGVKRCYSSTIDAKIDGSSDGESIDTTEIEKKYITDIEQLSKKLSETTEKCGTLEDKYKRALADGENLRIRLTKQIEDAKIFCIQGFCKDLLEVSDILQRATESVPKEEVTDNNPHLKSLYEGLTMTEAQLQSVFRRHGLVAVNPVNEKFDPNFHEALFQQEVAGKEPGTVVVVSKIGYKLHERVIRPALVGVAKSSN